MINVMVAGQYQNIVHFFVEDWFLSAALGIITAILSIGVDVAIEYLLHCEWFSFPAYGAKNRFFMKILAGISNLTVFRTV